MKAKALIKDGEMEGFAQNMYTEEMQYFVSFVLFKQLSLFYFSLFQSFLHLRVRNDFNYSSVLCYALSSLF